MQARCILPLAMLLGACAIPHTTEALDRRSPPPEFGRPMWVRVPAGAGAWLGGILGGAVSIVLLPITWPISELAGDALGEQGSGEFLFWPALSGAAVGHALLGTPPDAIDWLFRRAWVDAPDPVTSYEFIPLPGPTMPAPAAEPGAPK